MGGRGASSGRKRLPNWENAIIARNKLKNYLLNPAKSNGKSAFFADIGYNMKNWKILERDIRLGIKNNPAKEDIVNRYGHAAKAYHVDMQLGLNKKAIVITSWKHEEKGKPRLITAFPERKNT